MKGKRYCYVFKTNTSYNLHVLEENDSLCLDNAHERDQIAYEVMQAFCKEIDREGVDANIEKDTIQHLKSELLTARAELRYIDHSLDRLLSELGVSSSIADGSIVGRVEYLVKQRGKASPADVKSLNHVAGLTELKGVLQKGLEMCTVLLGRQVDGD